MPTAKSESLFDKDNFWREWWAVGRERPPIVGKNSKMSVKSEAPSSRKPSREEERLFYIGYLIHDVSRLRLRYFDAIFKNRGLTRNHWWTLANIHAQGAKGISQGDLGKLMGVKKAMMGNIIDQLESSGHVKRSPNRRDRRVRTIKETAKGQALSESMFDIVKGAAPKFHHEISEEDLATTVRTLARIQRNAIAMLSEGEDEEE